MSHNQAVGAAHDEPKIEGLQPGAKLLRGQYEIIRFLSNGGFGITYLARDSLDRDVVIKECYPGALCYRNGDFVEPLGPAYQEDLRAIIDLFIQEARNHARLVHPNIVDVHQVFEDNQTAYIAMDLIRGCDLLDYIDNPDNKTDPDFIVQVTEKMLSAVSFIHQSGMLHRDISPDNILVDENGEPILIDFGAAREQAANKSAALLTLRVIKDGYSPHEFYVRGAEQGPSSDLYVLAATLYHAISGERPIDGQSRLNAFNNGQDDPYKPLSGRFEGYPDGFLKAIDKAMEVHATDRAQTALDWLRMFRGKGVVFDSFEYRPVSVIVALDRPDEEAEKERIKAETENAEAVVAALLADNSNTAASGTKKKTTKQANNKDQPAKVVKQDDQAAALVKHSDQIATKAPPKSMNDDVVDTVVQSNSGGTKTIVGVAAVLVAFAAGSVFMMSGNDAKPTAEITAPETTTVADDTSASSTGADEQQKDASVSPMDANNEATEKTATAETVTNEVARVDPVEQASTDTEQHVEETAAVVADEGEGAAVELETTTNPIVPAENQIAFGHWDVDIPFAFSMRRASIGYVVAITDVDTGYDMSVIGEWVQRGAAIYTLNGNPVRGDLSFAAQVLDNVNVDPDGYIRVAARYRPFGEKRAQNGLLALPAVRMFGLQNGTSFAARNMGEAGWQIIVDQAGNEGPEVLKRGDVLLIETSTETPIEGPESLDEVLTKLGSEGKSEAHLTVLRNGAKIAAVMQLAQE